MYELRNHTEIVVLQALQGFLRHNKLSCSCDRCQADIMALALNRLPPRYFASSLGEILTQWESHALPDQARVMAEIVQAAQQVAFSPSHDKS